MARGLLGGLDPARGKDVPIEGDDIEQPRRSRAVTVVVVFLILAGIALRIWILASGLGAVDSDEAVVGLMAKHLLDGEFHTYFWGQRYGGTPVLFPMALLFRLFGVSAITLKLIPMMTSAVAAFLLWRIGRRTIGEPQARIAAALFWSWPAAFVWWSTVERILYWPTLVAGLVVVLCALRIDQEDGGWRDATLMGAAAGIGWWTNPTIIFFIVPTVLWLLYRRRLRALRLWPSVPAFLMGALPWLVDQVRVGWGPLVPDVARRGSFSDHLEVFFRGGLPGMLGTRVPFSREWLFGGFGMVLYALLLAVLVVALVRRRHVGVVALAIVLYPLIFAASPTGWYVAEPRYLIFLAPFTTLVIVRALVARTWITGATIGAVAAVALSVLTLARMEDGRVTTPHAPDVRVPATVTPVVDALDRLGITRAYANYWVAYRITFETREAIIVRPIGLSRYRPYDVALARARRVAYIIVEGSRSVERLERAFTRKGVTYQRQRVDGFVVYTPAAPVSPRELGGIPGEF